MMPPKDLPRIKGLRKRVGRCYELCGRAALTRPDWSLVHGFVVMRDRCMGHAWLERDGWVYDAVLDQVMRSEQYASDFKADERARCPGGQSVSGKVLVYGHWGPWNEENPPRKGLPRGPWNELNPAPQRP